jgi:WD40 repeat protein
MRTTSFKPRGESSSPAGLRVALGAVSATLLALLPCASQEPLAPADPPVQPFAALVRLVIFSPDGKLLAACTGDSKDVGEVTVWEVATRRPRFTHREPRGTPCIAFSPDNRILAVGTFTENARLLDAVTGQVIADLPGHGQSARSVAVSPDGKTLAVGSYDHTIRLWNLADRTIRATMTGHEGWVYALSFSADGAWLASGSLDKTVRLWDVAAGRLEKTFADYGNIIICVRFSSKGHWLATPCWDGSVKVREVPSGAVAADLGGGAANTAAFTPDGKTIAVGREARSIELFAVDLRKATTDDLKHIRALIARLDDDSYEAREQASKELLGFGAWAEPELRKAMKETDSAEVRIRARRLRQALRSPAPTALLRGHLDQVKSVAFSPDGKLLASSDKGGFVKLWDMAGQREVATLGRDRESDQSQLTPRAPESR